MIKTNVSDLLRLIKNGKKLKGFDSEISMLVLHEGNEPAMQLKHFAHKDRGFLLVHGNTHFTVMFVPGVDKFTVSRCQYPITGVGSMNIETLSDIKSVCKHIYQLVRN